MRAFNLARFLLIRKRITGFPVHILTLQNTLNQVFAPIAKMDNEFRDMANTENMNMNSASIFPDMQTSRLHVVQEDDAGSDLSAASSQVSAEADSDLDTALPQTATPQPQVNDCAKSGNNTGANISSACGKGHSADADQRPATSAHESLSRSRGSASQCPNSYQVCGASERYQYQEESTVPQRRPTSPALSVASSRSARSERYREMQQLVNEPEAPSVTRRSLLAKLRRFQSMGQKLTRTYGMQDSIDALEEEVMVQEDILQERLAQKGRQSNLKFCRRTLLMGTSFVEFINKRYDPLGIDLDGWTDCVMENISDFDNPFDKMHSKYHGAAEMSPEIEIVMTLGSSAFMFHLTKRLADEAAKDARPPPPHASAPIIASRPDQAARKGDAPMLQSDRFSEISRSDTI